MKLKHSFKSQLFSGMLFCSLGVLAWVLLSNYRGVDDRIVAVTSSAWACLFMMVVFVLLGFLTLRVSSWLTMRYLLDTKHRWKVTMAYVLVASCYLLIDYGFLVTAKLLADAAHPFTFPHGGMRILIVVWFVEMGILGLLLTNRAMAQVYRAKQRMAYIEEENAAARYTALQSQLNPHFLFNSLNTLVAEIEYAPQQAVQFTRCLADVYRYVLQVQQKRLITLYEELNFARSYLYLHQVRLGDCVTCNVAVSDEERDYSLPPLTLQLLLENVFKHNIVSATHPVVIDISVHGDRLSVSNTLCLKRTESSEGVGLANLSNRCSMMMGKAIQVDVDARLFTVNVPLYIYE